MNCTACHGEQGASSSSLYPTLAGMDAAVIYKQLDDFRAGERWWGRDEPREMRSLAVFYGGGIDAKPVEQ
jgi:cytochrome c553